MKSEDGIPEELRRHWQQLPEDEYRELMRTWELAGRVGEDDPETVSAGERRLLDAIENRPRYLLRIAAAAAVLVAAAGLLFFLIQEPPAPASTSEFMLILHGEPLLRYPEDEHQSMIAEYVAWARELGEKGRFIAGNELAPGGRILRTEAGSVGIEHAEPTEAAISGYFIIAAADLDEATRIAADCPHLKFDGIVEVRRIGTN